MEEQKKKYKTTKGWRLEPAIIERIQQLVEEHGENETWIVNRILGIALGVRLPPKPLPIKGPIKIAKQ